MDGPYGNHKLTLKNTSSNGELYINLIDLVTPTLLMIVSTYYIHAKDIPIKRLNF